MKRTLLAAIFGTVFAAEITIAPGAPAVLEASRPAPARPAFSWDTVPKWLIVRKSSAFSSGENRLLAEAPLVVFEKENGVKDAGSVEEGVLRAARAVKAVNPGTVTLFYWNAVINYGNYRANVAFQKNADRWALKKEGKPFLLKDRYPIYNLIDRGWQEWWIDTARAMATDPAIDGILIDAICKTVAASDGGRALYPDEEYGRAYFETATRLKDRIGGKLLVGNAIRAGAPGSNLQHLKYLDGSYVERWAVPMGGRSFESHVAAGMEAMSQALSQGKLILFNSGPDCYGSDEACPGPNEAGREEWMRAHIHFPLAVFLMIAEEGAFFHWGTGPNTLAGPGGDVWRNDLYEELQRPLGRPLAPARVTGTTYSRSFEHLDVSVDISTRQSTFRWH